MRSRSARLQAGALGPAHTAGGIEDGDQGGVAARGRGVLIDQMAEDGNQLAPAESTAPEQAGAADRLYVQDPG